MKNTIVKFIEALDLNEISAARIDVLDDLVNYLLEVSSGGSVPQLNFICTHNSRRSQFSQLWSKVMSVYFNFPVNASSGGTAVTACNERTIASLQRFGFEIEKSEGENPKYSVSIASNVQLTLFSKLFDDAENPKSNFAAVMTCSDADENCPFIPGCDLRIPLRYEDPKQFDDTELEAQKYDERSTQIAREMKYVFTKLT